MTFDAKNMFSDEQALTTTADATNVIATRTIKDVSKGNPVRVAGNVNIAFAVDLTLIVTVITDTVATFDDAAVTLFTSKTFDQGEGDLAAGKSIIDMVLPRGVKNFLKLVYTLSGTETAGKVTAGIVFDSQSAVD